MVPRVVEPEVSSFFTYRSTCRSKQTLQALLVADLQVGHEAKTLTSVSDASNFKESNQKEPQHFVCLAFLSFEDLGLSHC